MAGHPPMSGSAGESGHVASDNSPVDAMCEVTGGRSYAVTSARVLHQVSVLVHSPHHVLGGLLFFMSGVRP